MAGPIRITIVADGDRARREMTQTATAADRMGGRIGRSFATAGRVGAAGTAALAGGLAVIGKSAVQTESQFSQTMNLVGAATGVAGAKVEKLRDLAKDLGASTSFSANEAADAMLELAKAGLTPATIQAGALEGTLTLAAAGGTDLATAATVASNALNTFGLKGKDMASVAAALAGGANASSASVESLAYGLSQVGPGAINAGLSLQETVGVLSAFDAAGIKGSDAGTSLKTALTRLVPTTKAANAAMEKFGLDFVDGAGNIESITEVAQQLQDRLGGLSQAQRTQALATIFGSDASRAATVLMKEGEKGLRGYIRATKDQGAAEEMAKARMAGTAGALERLSGAAETSKLVIGEALAPVVVRVSDYLSENMVPATEQAVKWVEAFIKQVQAIKGDPNGELSKIGDALGEVDWPKAAEGAKDTAAALGEIGGAVGSASIDVFADSLKITGKALGFVADHSDELAAAMPFLIAGFVAYKGVTAAARASTALLIPLRLAELAQTRQQTIAIREMTIAMQQLTLAQRQATQGQWINGTWYSSVRANERATRGAGGAAGAAAGRFSAMGAAAKGAAGLAGIGGLTLGLQQASQEGATLGNVMFNAASGAGIGAMFGPVGALIGAVGGGGLTALVGAFADTKDEAETTRTELLRTEGFANAKRTADDLREALIGVKNAYGETVRASIEASFSKDGKQAADIARLRELGVSTSTLVSATLGQADAQRRVDEAFRQSVAEQSAALPKLKAEYDAVKDGAADLVTATGQVIVNGRKLTSEEIDRYRQAYEDAEAAVREAEQQQRNFNQRTTDAGFAILAQQRSVQALAADLGITVRQYKQYPRKVRTEFEANGLRQTTGDALRLFTEYKGLRRFDRIKAIISAPGVDLTRRQVRDLKRQYELTPRQLKTLLRVEGIAKTKSDLTGYQRSFQRGLAIVEGDASKSGKKVADNLRDTSKRAKFDDGPFRDSVRSGTDSARTQASGGGFSIGASLSEGVVYGAASRSEAVRGAIASQVRSAIAAGRAAARSKSPSRETFDLGVDLGKGLEIGINARAKQTKQAGRDLIAAALGGITGGSSGVDSSIDRLTSLIEKRVDLKDDRKERQRERAILRALNDEFKALKRIGKQRDALSDGNYLNYLKRESALYQAATKAGVKNLNAARDRYKRLVDEAKAYSASIRDSFVQYGSVIALGQGNGFADAGQLVEQLRARKGDAERFAAVVKELSKTLNQTTLQQIIDAGVEGGLGTAEAILAGGSQAIDDINKLTQDIAKAGGGLGSSMSKKFKQAGIDAAAGLVVGFEREQKRLDRAAERIGSSIVKAIKKELGIKSPSRVFRQVGEDTMAGLAIGLDETYARRLGARVGAGVEDGFKRPRLSDQVAITPGAATGGGVQVQTVRMRFSADQVSQMQRGREVVADVEVFFKSGGRSTSKWGGG